MSYLFIYLFIHFLCMSSFISSFIYLFIYSFIHLLLLSFLLLIICSHYIWCFRAYHFQVCNFWGLLDFHPPGCADLMFEMLVDFSNFLRRNNVTFMLSEGTLLGAVRDQDRRLGCPQLGLVFLVNVGLSGHHPLHCWFGHFCAQGRRETAEFQAEGVCNLVYDRDLGAPFWKNTWEFISGAKIRSLQHFLTNFQGWEKAMLINEVPSARVFFSGWDGAQYLVAIQGHSQRCEFGRSLPLPSPITSWLPATQWRWWQASKHPRKHMAKYTEYGTYMNI